MSIFSLAPILAIALNRHSSATSSATTSSVALDLFSFSALLISLVSGVGLYDISMASNRAQSSLIFLSMDGLSKVIFGCLLGSIVAICPHKIQP
jgi:hypothetical protein